MTCIPDGKPAAAPDSTRRWRLGSVPWQEIQPVGQARGRVIIDDDFSGDPDDLYQLVHHLLPSNVEITLVVGSHLRPGDPFDPSCESARNAIAIVHDVFARLGLESTEVIAQDADVALSNPRTTQPSPAADAVVAEALRDDPRPLFYVAGGGLTDIASAYLMDPGIANRLTLVWIGGLEHDGGARPPPDAMPIEYNLLIDVAAGQVVFNDSAMPIWQVPRDVYRQCLVSEAELRLRVAPMGPVGRYLYEELVEINRRTVGKGRGPGETYALGDSPLVLLTALQSLFEPDPSSSTYIRKPTSRLGSDGRYAARDDGRPMRLYTRVHPPDVRGLLPEARGVQPLAGRRPLLTDHASHRSHAQRDLPKTQTE